MELNKTLGREQLHKKIEAMNSIFCMEFEERDRRARIGKIEHWWRLWGSCPDGFPKCKTFIDVLRQQKIYQKETYREWREYKKTRAESQPQIKIIPIGKKD